ncbi:hypothetical protein ETA_34250 [Erwinia tasmaniensis Et1/99]|uniref:Uncharacterized protein n=1 Tax=Erwinia tasmaniensis (strain DSM 17950 / CFBP 7177 / CIP 109463 / NCPPB 4357 / Et1/99) TaxID=465817 RepID=B2VCF0_ERWT9|nr:hypothetical protein ETA_34250 [Erwinia tasmaniensis Et1/99]
MAVRVLLTHTLYIRGLGFIRERLFLRTQFLRTQWGGGSFPPIFLPRKESSYHLNMGKFDGGK